MSRQAKSIKNAKIGAFFFIISIFVQFFSRKIFLDFLGDDFIGLSSTLRSILGFINLAELGIGTAIGYSLYKPIFTNDYYEINRIIALLGILYKRIGFFIFGAGIIVSLFFPYFFGDTEFSLILIYTLFFSFLISSLLTYFINYHITLLEADQKGYVVQVYFQSFNIVRLLVQAMLAYYLQSYYVWIFMEVLFSILTSVILRIKVKQEYPWLIINSNEKAEIIKKYPEIIKKTKQLFLHKMGSFVKDGTDNILVYALVSLESVAFLGNYQLIFIKMIGLIKTTFAGTGAGIGNLVAENDEKNIHKVFWEMMALQFFIAGVFSLAIFYLISPFIILWIGNKYLLEESILILMVCNFFITIIRSPVEHFKNAYGLFSDTWAPGAEIILNLIISIIFGSLYGIFGIMLGTFTSLALIVMLWKPYFLYKKGFKKSVFHYWKGLLPMVLIFSFVAFFINYLSDYFYFNENNINIINWVAYSAQITLAVVLSYGILLFLFVPGFKNFVYRVRTLIVKRF